MKQVCDIHNKSMKWSDLFDSEEELVEAMLKCKVEGYMYQIVKGYEYVKSFQRYYKVHNELTEKQMTQLKRMAKSIYEHLYCNNGQGSCAEL